MRDIDCKTISKAVSELCIEANVVLPPETAKLIREAEQTEKSPAGRGVLADLRENYELAAQQRIPICQDTGMAV
ncbi:MAG: fumarate hydratase, partial [Clostridia bacterium]|nr:fumarate hydratase [Clostridia bacterium]